MAGVLVLPIGCSHAVGSCAHINDLRPIARPAHLTLVTPNPALGAGQGLDAGHASILSIGEGSTEIVVMWRSCTRLNRLDANETATTVTVTAEVSGCLVGYAGSTEPPEAGDTWFGGTLRLAHPLGRRTVVSANIRFCDTVTH